MSLLGPLRIPVELQGSERWFRMAWAVSTEGLELMNAVPGELEGAIDVAFHLPGDPAPLRCKGQIEERIVGEEATERAERRAVRFLDLAEEARTRITSYVRERLGLKQ